MSQQMKVLSSVHKSGLTIAQEVVEGKRRAVDASAAGSQLAALENLFGFKLVLFEKGHQKNDAEKVWAVQVSQGRRAVKFAETNKDSALLNMWRTGDRTAISSQKYIKANTPEEKILAGKIKQAVKLLGNLHNVEQYDEAMAEIVKLHNFRQSGVVATDESLEEFLEEVNIIQ